MRLQPGSDVGVDREAVVGAGSLKLPNLRQNLKLLHRAEMKKKDDYWTKQEEGQRTILEKEQYWSNLEKPPQGGDTYPSALLKVDQASLQSKGEKKKV